MKIKRGDLRRIIEEESANRDIDIDSVLESSLARIRETDHRVYMELKKSTKNLPGLVGLYKSDQIHAFREAVNDYLEGIVSLEIINIANGIKQRG
tara:strand:- start:245 stop:529 length:285 start_codon:yes stop_codon:yes gene_type:complete